MDEFQAIEDDFAKLAQRLAEDAEARRLALRGCSFFDPVPDAWLPQLSAAARIRTFHSDVCLTSQDEETGAFYVILRGTADAFRNGKRVGTIEAGECIGEAIFFSDGDTPSSATVIADFKIIAAEFPRETIAAFRADPQLMACLDKALLRALFRKLQGANRQIEQLV
ncbi:MAG: Crp/Fnr family transcriptional regulator [Rhodocyclaceae bacterium]|nr:Crp/Fnr family transcriptional regulator [Rhodocyclaceae bacterium]